MIETSLTGELFYCGFKISVNDIVMSETKEDWSNVRSPSRAKRRIKRGFNQNIIYKVVPKSEILRFGDNIIMHSETLKSFKNKLAEHKI